MFVLFLFLDISKHVFTADVKVKVWASDAGMYFNDLTVVSDFVKKEKDKIQNYFHLLETFYKLGINTLLYLIYIYIWFWSCVFYYG